MSRKSGAKELMKWAKLVLIDCARNDRNVRRTRINPNIALGKMFPPLGMIVWSDLSCVIYIDMCFYLNKAARIEKRRRKKKRLMIEKQLNLLLKALCNQNFVWPHARQKSVLYMKNHYVARKEPLTWLLNKFKLNGCLQFIFQLLIWERHYELISNALASTQKNSSVSSELCSH